MAEPELGPAAALVRRYDPPLFQTALFAPEPGRSRLMTIYAFDLELSRALSVTEEPMIARMRLQWWRDVVAGAAAGDAPPAHEIAAPLHGLIAERSLPVALLDGLIDAREMEIEGIDGRPRFDEWAALRFGGLTRLAAECLVSGAADRPQTREAAEAVGRALAAAFALRNAVPMAAERNRFLLPNLPEDSRASLARGTPDEAARSAAREVAESGLSGVRKARRLRRAVPADARAAFLPLGLAEPVLRRAAAGADLPSGAAPNAARTAAGTLWRALSSRW